MSNEVASFSCILFHEIKLETETETHPATIVIIFSTSMMIIMDFIVSHQHLAPPAVPL